ncbi:uncharacterized protein LOC130916170 isoform X2 [Corythoichthys intestinalis]|uniref:uncharacterized protein LOC130916170 isoform X2 n=1 Tax=Corythoichthys intestinalis TaxID=161448 RepID=UPI0025A5260C|nr:uncharacterized protein LOC130916170 isoform X2 [Corythoichthys intestinalis]
MFPSPHQMSFFKAFSSYVTIKQLHPEKHEPLHIEEEEEEMPYMKQEAEPETPYIKEEEEEDEISKSPMTVRVKSEEDKGPSEESGAAKLSRVSPFQHPTTKGERRSTPISLLAPPSDSDNKRAFVPIRANYPC